MNKPAPAQKQIETFESIEDRAVKTGETVDCPTLTLLAEEVSDTYITRIYAPIPPEPLAAPWIYHQVGVLDFTFKHVGNTIEFDVCERQHRRDYILHLYEDDDLVISIPRQFVPGKPDKFIHTVSDRLINRLRLERKIGVSGGPAQLDNFSCYIV